MSLCSSRLLNALLSILCIMCIGLHAAPVREAEEPVQNATRTVEYTTPESQYVFQDCCYPCQPACEDSCNPCMTRDAAIIGGALLVGGAAGVIAGYSNKSERGRQGCKGSSGSPASPPLPPERDVGQTISFDIIGNIDTLIGSATITADIITPDGTVMPGFTVPITSAPISGASPAIFIQDPLFGLYILVGKVTIPSSSDSVIGSTSDYTAHTSRFGDIVFKQNQDPFQLPSGNSLIFELSVPFIYEKEI